MTQVAPIIAKLVSFCWISMIESPVGVESSSGCPAL